MHPTAMATTPPTPGDLLGSWRLVGAALRARSLLSLGAVAAIVLAAVGLMQPVDSVTTAVMNAVLPGADDMTWTVAYRAVIVLVAGAVCVMAAMLATLISTPPDQGRVGGTGWLRLAGRAALAWLIALAGPYFYGVPWWLVTWMHWSVCCVSLTATMRIFAGLLCWTTLKAGLAAALLVGLPDRLRRQRRRRAFDEGRDLFLACLPLFGALLVPQAVIDAVYWEHLGEDWVLVSELAIIGDAGAALLTTLLAFLLRQRLDAATSPVIFD